MNRTERNFVPTSSYTYTMIIGLASTAVLFLCSCCLICLRTMFEREKRQRRAMNLQRLLVNLPDAELNDWQRKGLKEHQSPIAYGQMMTMLGKSIKEIDQFKDQLEHLPTTIAEKLGQVKGNEQLEHVQRALAQNRIHL